eukprot:TRINITY_DN993_c0_g1_i5.p1 TRINITY_DN993_c0_g1~~TRINITY_DN993_c0_g1_i5.p1  ORF type:complete len:158 (-),score=48.87 TRINITY_DN993_c0_g1_i5:104-577(-)
MIRRPPRSTHCISSAASDVYKRQGINAEYMGDQLPNLSFMLRTLEELSIMNTAAQTISNPFVVQQLPEIQQIITKNKNWKEIADYQKANYFNLNPEQQFQEMKKFAELYGESVIEGLVDGFKCKQCNKEASKRCSRCKQAWYCSCLLYTSPSPRDQA